MAGKSHRVAARQGELSRRRKRTQRGPSGIPATASARPSSATGGAATAAAVENVAAASVPSAPAAASPGAAGRPSAAAPSAAAARSPGRPRGERPAAYNYVGAELRRISILSGVVFAALIGLAFVL